MKLQAIKIALTPDWQKKAMGEYTATCELGGGSLNDKISVSIDPERCAQIVEIMEQAVAESMARAAAEFTQEVQARLAGPAVEQAAISAS